MIFTISYRLNRDQNVTEENMKDMRRVFLKQNGQPDDYTNPYLIDDLLKAAGETEYTKTLKNNNKPLIAPKFNAFPWRKRITVDNGEHQIMLDDLFKADNESYTWLQDHLSPSYPGYSKKLSEDAIDWMFRYFGDLEARIVKTFDTKSDFGGDSGEFSEDHSLWADAEKQILKEMDKNESDFGESRRKRFSTAWGKPFH